MDFKKELKEYQNIVNSHLEKYVKKEQCPEEVLNNSMEYSLMAGGKRLRPILAIATYQLFNKDYQKVIPYAIALEMVHNFSLIHDDLPGIDNDNFRHGKPTNHKKFNEATAILAGDGLLNGAFIVISEDIRKTAKKLEQSSSSYNGENIYLKELNNKTKVFNEFSVAIDRMIAGEYVDTEYEGKEITEELLEYIHNNKTGAFLKYSVRMGAILANASEEKLEKLTKYAENIGLAFQIKDDILSEEGDEAVLGKPVGNDKEMQKCTYVSKYGLDGAKKILDVITKEAVEIVKEFKNSEFLQELAKYIKDRNK